MHPCQTSIELRTQKLDSLGFIRRIFFEQRLDQGADLGVSNDIFSFYGNHDSPNLPV